MDLGRTDDEDAAIEDFTAAQELAMVRRGSTVRVRQRTSRFSLLAPISGGKP
jgi:hypothetical protein